MAHCYTKSVVTRTVGPGGSFVFHIRYGYNYISSTHIRLADPLSSAGLKAKNLGETHDHTQYVSLLGLDLASRWQLSVASTSASNPGCNHSPSLSFS